MSAATSVRDAEKLLRKQGFSRREAKIAVAGMKSQNAFKQHPKQNIITRIYRAITGE